VSGGPEGRRAGSPETYGRDLRQPDFGFEGDLYGDVADAGQPWRFSLSHYYDFRRYSTSRRSRSWVKGDLGFIPTRMWRVNYAVNYDLLARDLTAQSLGLYRDLHCWEASLAWYPVGLNRGFTVKLNIKEIPQIGLSHRQGGFGL